MSLNLTKYKLLYCFRKSINITGSLYIYEGEIIIYKEDFLIKQRMELVDGKIVMMLPRPKISHARVYGRIYCNFANYFKGKKCEVFGGNMDVFLDEKNRFVPDVMIVCNPKIIKEDGIHGAPDLVVEVLSFGTASRRDRGKKKDAYEKAGVKEYWIVDTIRKSVEVYLNENNHFYLDNVYEYMTDEEIAENAALPDNDVNKVIVNNEIKVSICEGLVINLKDIFNKI